MALSIQCLVSGLESETLSQNRAWSWNGVLEREQQASQALWDPWINVIPDDRVTRWEREGEGRVHASDLDRGVRWCLEREHKSRQGAVCWALEPSGMLGGAKCRDRPPHMCPVGRPLMWLQSFCPQSHHFLVCICGLEVDRRQGDGARSWVIMPSSL